MGELSKKIGEFGENVALEFFTELGWQGTQKGIEIPNMFPDKTEKKTYGIDYLFTYECPLIDNTIKNILISVKYHQDQYPDSYRALAKKHLIELSEMNESFNFSEVKSIANESINAHRTDDFGVLFWLSHKESDVNLRQELKNIRIDLPYPNTKIILCDNLQADFLLTSIRFFKVNFHNSKFEFYYHNTGQNINPLTKVSSGGILPIEFVSSSIIPFKITTNYRIVLGFATCDNFSKTNLRRVLGLAQEISTNLSAFIVVVFPDYDKLEHENDFQAVKSEFSQSDFIDKVNVANYNDLKFEIK